MNATHTEVLRTAAADLAKRRIHGRIKARVVPNDGRNVVVVRVFMAIDATAQDTREALHELHERLSRAGFPCSVMAA